MLKINTAKFMALIYNSFSAKLSSSSWIINHYSSMWIHKSQIITSTVHQLLVKGDLLSFAVSRTTGTSFTASSAGERVFLFSWVFIFSWHNQLSNFKEAVLVLTKRKKNAVGHCAHLNHISKAPALEGVPLHDFFCDSLSSDTLCASFTSHSEHFCPCLHR